MGVQAEEPQSLTSANVASSENIGEFAIVLIAVGSVLIVLCAASIIYGLHRRRRNFGTTGGDPSQCGADSIPHPTDFMNSLANWDRSHSIDDILEKRRRSKWSLEILESYGENGIKEKHLHTTS